MDTIDLTTDLLKAEAALFAKVESTFPEPSLYGVTDGKAVGTYLEQKFRAHLKAKYVFELGNSANGIDFPGIGVDVKVTSISQPQSSCPYTAGRQKVFGLGYSLLVFVYRKTDDPATQTGLLDMNHVVFVEKERTADYQMTTGLKRIMDNHGNSDDLVAFMMEKNLPIDEMLVRGIAEELLAAGDLVIGCLTISNALQWRLQYGRAIQVAGTTDGVLKIV
jgi:hypothetical protein